MEEALRLKKKAITVSVTCAHVAVERNMPDSVMPGRATDRLGFS